jgi:ribonuclease T2
VPAVRVEREGIRMQARDVSHWATLMVARLTAVALTVLGLAAQPALPQDLGPDEPGRFDFYVLSLSWSPSFCEADGERAQQEPQCTDRPYSFVVHGLWPQYERGFPESCQVPAPRLPRGIMTSMLDLMPAPRLIYHEWDTHGTCSGLSPAAYFDAVRKARGAVKIPPDYSGLTSALTVKPDDVKQAFIAANSGLSPDSIAIECDSKRLREIRICLTRDLAFRDCPNIARKTCRRDTVMLPPVRRGRTQFNRFWQR